MTEASEPITQLRDRLLRDTVAWCVANSSYYRKRFPDPERFGGLADLPTLPVLFRQDVIDNHHDLLCDHDVPVAIQHTTGTTGAFLEVYRGATEQAFVWDFFSAQLAVRAQQAQLQQPEQPHPGQQAEPPVRPLHLNLVNAYHGALTAMPSRAYVLSAGVYDHAQASQARGLLERTYELPGVESQVSLVMGTERMVKALTAYLLEDGFDLAGSGVRTIQLFGGHVTPARKLLLGKLWNAAVHDAYSLTEVFGGATECGIGGPWVFDAHVVPEIVHPRTHEPVDEGVGVLLLTTLYPFTQQMPFIRYWTNDLVDVVAPAHSPQGLQVRYVGRLPRSIVDDRGPAVRPLLLSGPLYEIVESIPDIAISPRFPDLIRGPALELTGDHHFGVHRETYNGVDTITITLGLRYAPWMYEPRVASVVAEVTARVLAAHPELAQRVAGGQADLRIVPVSAGDVSPYDSK